MLKFLFVRLACSHFCRLLMPSAFHEILKGWLKNMTCSACLTSPSFRINLGHFGDIFWGNMGIKLGANKQIIWYFFPSFRISDRILRAEKWREVQKSITPMLDLETVRLVSEISEHHLILLLVSEIMSLEQLVILFQILPILYIGITKFFLSSATLRNMFSNFW